MTKQGFGITPENIRNAKSLGLIGMHERALLLYGEVSIGPAETRGTQVTVRILADEPSVSQNP